MAQGRLGDVEPHGRAAEVQLLGHGQEVAQEARANIDGQILSSGVGTNLGRPP
jgi:hypothetical protein